MIYDCGGINVISFLSLGQGTSVSVNEKQLFALSLYCNKCTFSGVGYTIIFRVSGVVIYTAKIPINKLRINTGKFIYLKTPITKLLYYTK